MIIVGSAPWDKASKTDQRYELICNGYLSELLKHWNRDVYVNSHLIDLFESFFKPENKRIDLEDVKKHCWFK